MWLAEAGRFQNFMYPQHKNHSIMMKAYLIHLPCKRASVGIAQHQHIRASSNRALAHLHCVSARQARFCVRKSAAADGSQLGHGDVVTKGLLISSWFSHCQGTDARHIKPMDKSADAMRGQLLHACASSCATVYATSQRGMVCTICCSNMLMYAALLMHIA